MPRNPIEFQSGLSLPAFLAHYGTEAQCQAALYWHRWPSRFVCPVYGNTTGCRLSRGLYQCHRCHRQASLTVGTIFHATYLPITIWFLAIYLLTQRKNSLSALQLSCKLGVSYNTAWKLNLLQVMHERNQGETLGGHIEIDDAYLGDERNLVLGAALGLSRPFATVVQTDDDGHLERVQLRRVSGFTQSTMRLCMPKLLSPPAVELSVMAWCVFGPSRRRPSPMNASSPSSGRASAHIPAFNWVNTVLGNIKNAIMGSYHVIRDRHLPRYLAKFEYLFNWRHDLKNMIPRFLTVVPEHR